MGRPLLPRPPARDFHASPATVPATRRQSAPWWIACCLGSAALAFVAGRATAPDQSGPVRAAEALASAKTPGRPTPVLAKSGETAPSGAAEAAAGNTAALPDRQAEIVALLNRFKNADMRELNSEIIALIAWSGNASPEDLELFMALGKEILPTEGMHREIVLPLAFTRWVELDAPAAFGAYLALEPGERSGEVANILFGNWVLQGAPRDAIDHALALQRAANEPGSEAAPPDLVGNMLRRLSKKDPGQARLIAMEFARSNDPQEKHAAAHSAESLVTGMLGERGPDDTLAWIESWPDAQGREQLRHSLAERLLEGDEASRRAGMAIFSTLADPDRGMIGQVARQKMEANAPEAQAWALAMPPGQARVTAVQEVMNTLKVGNRTDEAARWLATAPRQTDLDPAYGELAVWTFDRAAALPAAAQWTRRITDPGAALRARGALIEQWLSIDRERATEVLGAAMENTLLAQPR